MFPFLLEILSLAAETPSKKDVWFLLLLCSHCNLKEELKEVKGQKQYQEEDYAQVWAPCQEEALIAIILFVTLRIRWKLPGKLFPSRPLQRRRSWSSWYGMQLLMHRCIKPWFLVLSREIGRFISNCSFLWHKPLPAIVLRYGSVSSRLQEKIQQQN